MIIVSFTPQFRKMFSKLETDLQEEALDKIELFRNSANHTGLKVHKLKGIHNKHYSFSINYKNCIVFMYLTKTEVVLLGIGDHDIYK